MLFICYPNCSTCKKARAFLDGQGADFTVRDIKADRPTEEELRLWHAESGLPLKKFFNTSGQQYKALDLKDRLPAMSEVSALVRLSSGELYAGTLYSGLYRILGPGEAECVLRTGSKIISLFEDSRQNLWICTRSEGLYRLDTEGELRRFAHDPNNRSTLADNYVRCICEDNDGRLWIGMMFGLDCYDPQTDAFYHFVKCAVSAYGDENIEVAGFTFCYFRAVASCGGSFHGNPVAFAAENIDYVRKVSASFLFSRLRVDYDKNFLHSFASFSTKY